MSIHTADDNSSGYSEETAEAALMASFDPPSDDGEGEDEGDPDGGEEEQGDEPELEADEDEDGDDAPGDEEDAGEGDEPPAAAEAVNDDQTVEVTINGEAQAFTIGSLKRLAGQEASLTRKSQEADLVGGRAAAALQAAIETVQEDLQPYETVDWLVLQQQVDPETFAWHRENAARLDGKFRKLIGAAQSFEETLVDRRKASDKEAIEARDTELRNDIPGWNEQLHSEVLAYGVSQGLDQADMASVTNPKVLKLVRQAMLYSKGQKVATTKVKEAPTKVIKGSNRADNSASIVKSKKAEQRLAVSGSDEDAAAVLMGRWG